MFFLWNRENVVYVRTVQHLFVSSTWQYFIHYYFVSLSSIIYLTWCSQRCILTTLPSTTFSISFHKNFTPWYLSKYFNTFLFMLVLSLVSMFGFCRIDFVHIVQGMQGIFWYSMKTNIFSVQHSFYLILSEWYT